MNRPSWKYHNDEMKCEEKIPDISFAALSKLTSKSMLNNCMLSKTDEEEDGITKLRKKFNGHYWQLANLI